MKNILLAILLGCSLLAAAAEPTLVYLVRHAEKVDESKDADLSGEGLKRADCLRLFFDKIPLNRVIATQYIRTQKTVAPVADARSLPIQVVSAGEEEKVAAMVRESKGEVFLISGHSNTIPKLINLLGGPAIEIGHDDYNNLFLIILDEDRTVFQNFQLDPQ